MKSSKTIVVIKQSIRHVSTTAAPAQPLRKIGLNPNNSISDCGDPSIEVMKMSKLSLLDKNLNTS